MKKKKHVTPRAVAAPKHAAKPNPFELKGSKRKFDVLGKRDKDGKKNVIKSREEAVNKRKKTLLVEYKQLRKANTFIDRRFGEDDPRLNEEDKALARFQAQRIREAKKATRFHLQDGSAAAAAADGGTPGKSLQQQHMLTHGGVSLEELEEMNSRPTELLGDLDDDLLEDLVQQYHFGGGEEQQEGAEGEAGQHKTKKQVMEEIIAKSKAAKAEKARQKEADEAALDALDSSFKAISGGLAAFVKPAGFEKGRKQKADTEEDAAYDRAARELVFEAKGQASERTLTAEELQEKEQQRLAALEAARLKRMRAEAGSAAAAAAGDEGGSEDAADDDDGGAAGAAGLPQGGYAAKRERMQREAEQWEKRQRRKMQASGDDLDENFALPDEEDEGEDGSELGSDEGGNALDARRQAAAAGDHPLQKAFRQAAAKLAAKYGVEAAAGPGEEGGSSEEEGSDGDDEAGEGGSDSDSDSEAHSEEGSEEDEQLEGLQDEGEEDESGSDAASDDNKQESDDASSSDEEGKPKTAAAAKQQKPKQQQPEQQLDGPLDLSYTPPVPESYAEFAALVGGRPAEQLELAVQRIRVYNAATLGTDNKRKLQVFYGILVQHFAMLAGEQPTPAAHLDILTQVLLQLTPEVPFYAATVARTRLEKMHDRLAAALADPLGSTQQLMGWPGPRQLLQLRLFALLFPASDRRHPVMTPLALLLGKHLSQCPVVSCYTAAVGLLCCGMALANAADAQRFCPEVVSFLAAALRAFAPAPQQQQAADGKQQSAAAADAAAGVSLFRPGLLALSCCSLAAAGSKSGKQKAKQARKHKQQQNGAYEQQQQQQLPSLKLYQLLSSAPDAVELSNDEFKLALLGCTVATATRACQLSSGCGVAVPEVLQPLLSAVAAVLLSMQGLSAAAEGALQRLQQQLQQASSAVVATRQPMVQSHRVKLVAPREFNPRYEADFAAGADYDPDRQRSSQRKLQRQLVKEKRGAMRELRRDATFMSSERDAEKARVDAERLASERAFYSELQVQEADAKSGGQRGMNQHRKKK